MSRRRPEGIPFLIIVSSIIVYLDVRILMSSEDNRHLESNLGLDQRVDASQMNITEQSSDQLTTSKVNW